MRTLAEWSIAWPYLVERHLDTQSAHTADAQPVDVTLRQEAFHLADYVVSSVAGGSLWFVPRAGSEPDTTIPQCKCRTVPEC